MGLADALFSYFVVSSGIDHSIGCLIVICSSALLLVMGVILAAAPGAPTWLRVLLLIGCFLDPIGTGFAAWFLHAWVLLGAMAAALVAWLLVLVLPGRRGLEAPGAARGLA